MCDKKIQTEAVNLCKSSESSTVGCDETLASCWQAFKNQEKTWWFHGLSFLHKTLFFRLNPFVFPEGAFILPTPGFFSWELGLQASLVPGVTILLLKNAFLCGAAGKKKTPESSTHAVYFIALRNYFLVLWTAVVHCIFFVLPLYLRNLHLLD